MGLTLEKLAVRAPFNYDKMTIDSVLESKMIKLLKLDIPTFEVKLPLTFARTHEKILNLQHIGLPHQPERQTQEC